jgi:ribosome-associated toxin RatA of RatAB toxin-antitoxin module
MKDEKPNRQSPRVFNAEPQEKTAAITVSAAATHEGPFQNEERKQQKEHIRENQNFTDRPFPVLRNDVCVDDKRHFLARK